MASPVDVSRVAPCVNGEQLTQYEGKVVRLVGKVQNVNGTRRSPFFFSSRLFLCVLELEPVILLIFLTNW